MCGPRKTSQPPVFCMWTSPGKDISMRPVPKLYFGINQALSKKKVCLLPCRSPDMENYYKCRNIIKNKLQRIILMKKIFLFLGLLITLTLISLHTSAQAYKMNFGLSQPQDPATLPISKAAPLLPDRKQKIKIVPELEKISGQEFLLNKGWELMEADKVTASEISIFNPEYNTSDWHNATVPGTVLTTLVDQGIYPDPYYGLNNMLIPDSLCRINWWYRVSFNLPEEKPGNNIWLQFNGINYKADIWLNGNKLGRMEGAFKRGIFNATQLLNTTGQNILAVQIFPPHNPGIPHEQSSKTNHGPNGGQLCLDGPTFISSEGWDWVPGIRDRNIGIWQDVRLLFTGDVTLIDPQVITDLPLPDTSQVFITVRTELKNHSDKPKRATIRGQIESVEFSKTIDLLPGETKKISLTPEEFSQLKLAGPRLWWPNGYGNPELYRMNLEVKSGEVLSDQQEIRFGVREFSYELSVALRDSSSMRAEFDPLRAGETVIFNNIDRVDFGKDTYLPQLADPTYKTLLKPVDNKTNSPFLIIKVNGVPVFCKGGNWGMDDGMKRVSRERLEPYFKLHQLAGFNMIRNWTGESTEEVFYQLSDEYGLLVWNDFWLSTEGYNLNVNDNILFMENATDVVRRFRNHASIAIWCPRNEGYAPPELELQLARLIAMEDGTRHYAPNSRNLNLRPSGPWHYIANPTVYYTDIAEGFNTELGTPSVPTAATIRSFIPQEDQWPISDTWHYHDFHNGQPGYLKDIITRYGEIKDLDDFSKKAQMVNYDSHRAMFESWNSKLWNNASGLLLWMTHPAWPSTVWQTYSWDYETFGSFYGSRKACEPLHIQMNLHDNKVVVVNTSQKNYRQLDASLHIYGLTGKKLHARSVVIDSNANQLTECFPAELPGNLPPVYILRLVLSDKNQAYSFNDYILRNGGDSFQDLNKLPESKITAGLVGSEGKKARISVTNTGMEVAIALKFNLRNSSTGEIVLPAYFSEGYINLLPGESREIEVETGLGTLSGNEVVCEGYTMKPASLLKIY